jgi:hypothetical protein
MAFSFNTNYAINNENTVETLHAHDVRFSVFIKNGEQLLSQATVKVLINNLEVAKGTSNELGKVDLLVKSYKHEKATIVTSYDGQTKTMKNVTLQNGKFYYVDFAIINTNDVKKEVEEKRVMTDKVAEEIVSQEKTQQEDEKQPSEVVTEPGELTKAELKYERKLKRIKKCQRKIDKANIKLDKSQKKLDAKKAKVDEDAEFLKIKDRQRRIDRQRNRYKSKQLKLNRKLKKLNKIYNK